MATYERTSILRCHHEFPLYGGSFPSLVFTTAPSASKSSLAIQSFDTGSGLNSNQAYLALEKVHRLQLHQFVLVVHLRPGTTYQMPPSLVSRLCKFLHSICEMRWHEHYLFRDSWQRINLQVLKSIYIATLPCSLWCLGPGLSRPLLYVYCIER